MNIANKRILNILTKIKIMQNTQITKNTISSHNKPLNLTINLNSMFKLMLKKNLFAFSKAQQASIFQQIDQEKIVQGQESNLKQFIKNPKTINILQNKGIKSLFSVQIETFQAVYQGRDILASDRTGSGKTIAYSLPIIQKFRDDKIFKSGNHQVKFLVLCPTRQLALQVFNQISSLKHTTNDFSITAVYGGSSMDSQIRDIKNGIDIIVATPGRLMDLMEKKIINFSQLEATCIDQADQMLQKGFKLDVQEIYKTIFQQRKQKTQNLMFSATIPEWVDKISREYLSKDKKRVNLIRTDQIQTSKTVQHFAIQCKYHDRAATIKNLIRAYNPQNLRTIIFSQTKAEVTSLATQFGKQASFLQGDMSQRQRQYNLNAFRNGKTSMLIATDVASRGLDIDNVGLVIQLEPPRNTQPFIHRAGRTGRAGKKGISITLFDSKKNLHDMLRIQEQSNIIFNHAPRPTLQLTQQSWLRKLNKLPYDFKKLNVSSIKNQKLDIMAESIITSHSDVKQLVKKSLVLLSGEPPRSHSLISQSYNQKTYLLECKQNQNKFNGQGAQNFIKKTIAKFFDVKKIQLQRNSILFDIPIDKVQEFQKMIQSQIIQDSMYKVREAKLEDKLMLPLRQLRKTGSGSSISRQSYRNSPYDAPGQNDKLQIFIPSLPFEFERQQLIQILQGNQISIKSLRFIKKSPQNVFAFLECSDSKSFMSLLKNGLMIQDKKIKVKKADSNYSSSNSQNNRRQENRTFSSSNNGKYRQNNGYGQNNRNQYRQRGNYQSQRNNQKYSNSKRYEQI